MSISNEEAEKLIKEYSCYVEKIINRFYYFASPDVKDELYHVGLIGLWKGILAYYKKTHKNFDRKEFVDTICAYIRYKMADLFLELKPIRISGNQWRNFSKVNRLLTANPDMSEEQLKAIITESGLRYDWYLNTKKAIDPASLDMTISENSDNNIYELLAYDDNEVNRFENQSYIDYIIDSAMYGIKLERNKELICIWLKNVNDNNKLNFTELGKMYNLTSSMVRVIINRFIDICRFVRDCEYDFFKNPDGIIYLPEISKNKTHNQKKIPGVK